MIDTGDPDQWPRPESATPFMLMQMRRDTTGGDGGDQYRCVASFETLEGAWVCGRFLELHLPDELDERQHDDLRMHRPIFEVWKPTGLNEWPPVTDCTAFNDVTANLSKALFAAKIEADRIARIDLSHIFPD